VCVGGGGHRSHGARPCSVVIRGVVRVAVVGVVVNWRDVGTEGGECWVQRRGKRGREVPAGGGLGSVLGSVLPHTDAHAKGDGDDESEEGTPPPRASDLLHALFAVDIVGAGIFLARWAVRVINCAGCGGDQLDVATRGTVGVGLRVPESSNRRALPAQQCRTWRETAWATRAGT
jgi:hypothetical protein